MVKKIFSVKIGSADYKTDELEFVEFDVKKVLDIVRIQLQEKGLRFKGHTVNYVLEEGSLYVKGEAYS